MNTKIKVKELLLVGGGHAHVHTIKMFGMNPLDGVQVTLITRDVETPYSGMLPGYVAGYYTREECHIDLGKLCSFAGVRLIHAEACKLDTEKKLVYCADGRPPIRYDVLSIDIGISPKPLPTATTFSRANLTPVKPIDGFARRWEIILARVMEQSTPSSISAATGSNVAVRVAIVGGGAGGTELCFHIHHRIRNELIAVGKDPASVEVFILQRGNKLMTEHSKSVQRIVNRLVEEKGIKVIYGAEIIGVEVIESSTTIISSSSSNSKSYLTSADGRKFEFDEAIWCTQAAAQSWLKESGLETIENGFVSVKTTLESVNVKDVFACGDVAHLVDNPRPKAGVFAVRAGPPLTANLRKRLLGEQNLEPWIPQSLFLGIIGTGEKYAIASKGAMGIEGAYLWKLKDRIDRVWMSGYQDLPDMEEMMKLKRKNSPNNNGDDDTISEVARSMGQETIDMLSKSKMRCGGCGSKVGAQVLSRAMSRIKNFMSTRSEIIAGIGMNQSDDAALVTPPPPPMYMVHTIDYFRSIVSDPYVFGQIACNHSLSDVHAMNGEAVSVLALCVLPYGPEQQVEDTLVHMLAGAMKVLKADGCSLVGGHTSEGAEAALGFAVNGIVHPDKVLRKGSPNVGDVIIITKGLGTGTIMAADMRAKARGTWVSAAFSSMMQSNAPAAKLLYEHGCSGCTDVTGFGFLGHLIEMIKFNDIEEVDNFAELEEKEEENIQKQKRCSVKLNLDSIPLLPGASECVLNGVFSSLHPQNIRCSHAVANVEFGKGIPSYLLLYDPQTAGGLVASVPADGADILISRLQQAGYHQAAIVGRVIERGREDFAPLIFLE